MCMHSMTHSDVPFLTENVGAIAKGILSSINTTKELTVFSCADSSEDPVPSDLLFSQL